MDVTGRYIIGGLVGELDGGSITNCHTTGQVSTGSPGEKVGGLVGRLTNGSISNCHATGAVTGGGYVGGLVGQLQEGSITNCYTTGTVTNPGTGSRVGGLVGYQWKGAITDSYATGAVTGRNWVGGLVGSQQGTWPGGSITRCYATGDVSYTGTPDYGYYGGLVGDALGDITDCYATGAVTGTLANVGGLVGRLNHTNATITRCHASGTVTGEGAVSYVGGLLGRLAGGTVTASFWNTETTNQGSSAGGAGAMGRTTAQMQTQTTFTDYSWDFPGTWRMSSQITFNGYPTLTWTQSYAVEPSQDGGVYQVANLTHLVWITENSSRWAYDYEQIADVTGTITNSWDGGAGWTAIGGTMGTGFSGIYDGGGHTVDGLFVNRPGEHSLGMFRWLQSTATVANLGVTNVHILGGQDVGGLVGYIEDDGIVSNCYTTGVVTGLGGYNAGGLAGSNAGTVNQCYSTVAVTGIYSVGGLVGFNMSGTVSNCYARGAVTGSGGDIGGLVGFLDNSSLTNCYSTGLVGGTGGDIGGLLGTYLSGSVNFCYWDTDASGQSGSAGGTGKTTTQMKDIATYTNGGASWNFTTIWFMHPEYNNGYPQLRWAGEPPPEPTPTPTATNTPTSTPTPTMTPTMTPTVTPTPTEIKIPDSPTGVSAGDGVFCDRVVVTWNPSTAALAYSVWRNLTDDANTSTRLGIVPAAVNTLNDFTATAGTPYYYWVKAGTQYGASPFSLPDTGWTRLRPHAPSGVSASQMTFCDRIRVTWNAVSCASGYSVWRSEVEDVTTAVRLAITPSTAFNDFSVLPGVLYAYWIRAGNDYGSSEFTASATGQASLRPHAPMGVSASAGTFCDRIRVTWNAVGCASGYSIWRSETENATTATRVAVTPSTVFNDFDATPGVTYYYWIRAGNAYAPSDFSARVSGVRCVSP